MFWIPSWVQFAGASGTINGSFNVSSVTYISLGVWSVNFTTAMPNANYAAVLGSTDVQSNSTLNFMNIQSTNLPTTTACRMQCTPSGGGNGLANPTQVHCTIFSS